MTPSGLGMADGRWESRLPVSNGSGSAPKLNWKTISGPWASSAVRNASLT